MEEDDDIMTAEEFFGISEKSAGRTRRKGRSRGKKKGEALLAEVKVKMVMRIHGISRQKALEMIAAREAEKKVAAGEEPRGENEAGEFMSAAEFFGN